MNEADERVVPETFARGPLPPATFEFLVLSLRAQAEMQLGLLFFGGEAEKTKPDLELARHTIDTLSMLLEKTKGNLTPHEDQLLSGSLSELRLAYIEINRRSASRIN